MAYPVDRIQLFDRNMNPLRELAPSEVTKRVRKEEINGEHELTVVTSRKLEEGWRALTVDGTGKWYEWVVVETPEEHSDGGNAVGTYRLVWSLQYDLTNSYVHTESEIGYGAMTKTAAGAAALILDGVERWEVGTCDGANIEQGKGAVFIYESAWSKLSKAVELTGWEVDAVIEVSNLFSVTARKLCLKAHVGQEAPNTGDGNLIHNATSMSASYFALSNSQYQTTSGAIRLGIDGSTQSYAKRKVNYLDYATYGSGTYAVSFDVRVANVTSSYSLQSLRSAVIVYPSTRVSEIPSSSHDRYTSYTYFTNLTDDWKRFHYTVTLPGDLTTGSSSALVDGSQVSVFFYLPTSSKPIEIRHIKLEAGDTATPWNPATALSGVVPVRRFDWGHDVTSIKRTPDPGPYYCRVVPLGKGTTEYADDDETSFEWPLDITEETGTHQNPGPYYIEDEEAALAFRISDGEGGWIYPTKAVSYNEDDPELLLAAAEDDLHNHTRPGVTYEANVVQFARAGMDVHGVALGDDVHIVDRGFNPGSALRLQGRVTTIEVDELSPETGTELTIGNVRDNMANTFADMKKSLGNLAFQNTRIFSSLHDMSTAAYIDELLQRINAEINATGGYSYFVIGEGLITYDVAVEDPLDGHEASKVVQIKGGSIRIADSKKSTFLGIDDWNWTTVFTADGINADLVTAAKITTGYIGNANGNDYWDLDSDYLTVAQGTINAGTIHGGTMTLGGANNVNGILQVIDASGNVIDQLDNTGATISGMLTLVTDGYRTGAKRYSQMGSYVVQNAPATMDGTIHGLKIYSTGEQTNNTLIATSDASSFRGTPTAALTSEKDLILYSWLTSSYSGMFIEMESSTVRIGYKKNYPDQFAHVYVAEFGTYSVFINGNLTVDGTKSRSAKTDDYGNRLLYAYETPTPTFGDIGSARTDEDGYAYVSIDDIFSETARTDIWYTVFLQKRGEGDLWVAEKQAMYFLVRGTPNLAFDWEIKCVQRGYENIRLENDGLERRIDEESSKSIADSTERSYDDEWHYIDSIESLYEEMIA